jgi:hypothetical protein
MSPRQIRVRAAVRFAALTATVAAWLIVAHAIPAAVALAVGL